MRKIEKLKILRCFRNSDRFYFDNSRSILLVIFDRSLKLLDLRSNTFTELYSGRKIITACSYCQEDGYVYFSVTKSWNCCTLYKFFLNSGREREEIILPLTYCEHMLFEEGKLVTYGMWCDTHVESGDGHELIDEIPSRVRFDSDTINYSLEVGINNEEYELAFSQRPKYSDVYCKIQGTRMHISHNANPEHYDESKWYDVFDIRDGKNECIESIPGERPLDYVGEADNFERYSLIRHNNWRLLIGHTGFSEENVPIQFYMKCFH